MVQDSITLLILAPQCGMDGHTPTGWELDSAIAQSAGGASALVTATAIIPGITRGGAPWAITDGDGIPTTAGAPGAERRWPMCTASGEIPPTHARLRPGRIPTPAITAPPAAVPTTTPRPAGPPSLAAVPTPISTPATRPDIVAAPPTIPTLGSSRVAALDMRAIFTPARGRPVAAASLTTPIPGPAWPVARTISTRARMELSIATTARQGIGRPTAEVAGSPRPSPTPTCS